MGVKCCRQDLGLGGRVKEVIIIFLKEYQLVFIFNRSGPPCTDIRVDVTFVTVTFVKDHQREVNLVVEVLRTLRISVLKEKTEARHTSFTFTRK